MRLLIKLTLILYLVTPACALYADTPTMTRGINQKPHPGVIPLGTAVLIRGETKYYRNLRKVGDIGCFAPAKNEYIEAEPFNARYMRGRKNSGIIKFMLKVSVAENAPYGEYYAPVYYSTYTDKHGKVHEDVGEVRIIVQETEQALKHPLATKIFRRTIAIIIVVLASIVGLAMIFYILIRMARGSEELDIEEAEIEEEYDEENTDDGD